MKLKCRPDDFRVEELPTVSPGAAGAYTFYRLTKRNVGTIEAVQSICRSWNLSGRSVAYGGLKDRHAETIQYLTIADGPRQPLRNNQFDLEPLGRLPHPFGPGHFSGNRFQITIRDLTDDELARASTALRTLETDGLPNYFDDQRFGSVGRGGEFIGEAWLKGDFERALKLVLAEPNPSDRAPVRAQKAIIRQHWGDWAELKTRLDRSSERSIVTYLGDHPSDHRGAFARLPRELRTLYFSAFQSYLWNLALAAWIESNTRTEQRIPVQFKVGPLPFPRELDPSQSKVLAATPIPLPSSRNRLPDGPLGEVMKGVVARFGLEWPDLRVKYLKDVFFSKGTRQPLAFPTNLRFAQAPDPLHRRRHALELSFDLAKGLYATILVKRITDVAESEAAP
jgi:tRNA pseudouridine13 synthase